MATDWKRPGSDFMRAFARSLGNGAAFVTVVVLKLGVIELIVLEALAHAVDVVHVGVEGRGLGVLGGVGGVGLGASVGAGLAAAALIVGILAANDVGVEGVAVEDGFEGGLLLGGGRLGRAGAIDVQGAGHGVGGEGEAELAGHHATAIVLIDAGVDENATLRREIGWRDGLRSFDQKARRGIGRGLLDDALVGARASPSGQR